MKKREGEKKVDLRNEIVPLKRNCIKKKEERNLKDAKSSSPLTPLLHYAFFVRPCQTLYGGGDHCPRGLTNRVDRLAFL